MTGRTYNQPQRVLICGSRTFTDRFAVHATLRGIRPSIVIHGGARGADTLADDFAEDYDIPTRCFPARWDLHGKAAGAIRNQNMLAENPGLVVAFVDKPLAESKGTADMVRRARNAGVPVYVIQVDSPLSAATDDADGEAVSDVAVECREPTPPDRPSGRHPAGEVGTAPPASSPASPATSAQKTAPSMGGHPTTPFTN